MLGCALHCSACCLQDGSGLAKLIPHLNPEGVDLIQKLLIYDPDQRLSARQALRHPYFLEFR